MIMSLVDAGLDSDRSLADAGPDSDNSLAENLVVWYENIGYIREFQKVM